MSDPAAQRMECSLDPAPVSAPGSWSDLLLAHWDRTREDPRAAALRAQLGLPTDRPIVMTGHQPILFHPGVLAKYIAASALAERTDAAAAFLIVDQDETDPGAIRVPVRTAGGRLGVKTVRLLDAPPEGVPAGRFPARERVAHPPHSPWPFVRDGLERIAGAFASRADAGSLAERGALASFDLMRPLGAEGIPLLASRLSRTDLFAELVERMRERPLQFVERYNDAVASRPDARVSPLRYSIAGDVYELPLWAHDDAGRRRRAYAHDLERVDPGALAPRALLMTLLLRLAGCDLFIHGAGGLRYDRITERLAQTWLGETLAPMTLATATLSLPLLDRPAPSRADVAHAAWLAHRAIHDPEVIGDEEAARRKAERRARIDALPRRSPQRAAAFRAMHDDLAEIRERRADAIRALRERAEGTAAAFLDSRVALDREWAFPLHPPEALGAMRSSIERAFGAEVSAPPRT